MKATRPDGIRFPRIYQTFDSVQEIANVINRSKSYVNKALKVGFTPREWKMLAKYSNRTDLSQERIA
jgi:hypothetical protein